MSRKKKLPVHTCAQTLQNGPIEVAVIGCGGNGAQMLSKLARLDYALRAVGHPGGLDVTVFDPDVVTPSNIGRQLFSPSDVGRPKACVLVHRLNAFWGLNWVARPVKFLPDEANTPGNMERRCHFPQLLISCVDTAKTRRDIHNALEVEKNRRGFLPYYWLDLGNAKNDGQVILGQPKGTANILLTDAERLRKRGVWDIDAEIEKWRLPCVTDLFPELLDHKFKESDEPSCSLADALNKQSLFVNDHISDWAMQLLDSLLRGNAITHHGAFINLETGRVNPLPVPKSQCNTTN